MTSRLDLPWPPSVNNIWRRTLQRVGTRVVARTLLSREAREYRAIVAGLVMAAKARRWGDARLVVALTCHAPDQRARDLDNLGKAVLDALTHAGVWDDDSQIDCLTYLRNRPEPGGRIVVEIGAARATEEAIA